MNWVGNCMFRPPASYARLSGRADTRLTRVHVTISAICSCLQRLSAQITFRSSELHSFSTIAREVPSSFLVTYRRSSTSWLGQISLTDVDRLKNDVGDPWEKVSPLADDSVGCRSFKSPEPSRPGMSGVQMRVNRTLSSVGCWFRSFQSHNQIVVPVHRAPFTSRDSCHFHTITVSISSPNQTQSASKTDYFSSYQGAANNFADHLGMPQSSNQSALHSINDLHAS